MPSRTDHLYNLRPTERAGREGGEGTGTSVDDKHRDTSNSQTKEKKKVDLSFSVLDRGSEAKNKASNHSSRSTKPRRFNDRLRPSWPPWHPQRIAESAERAERAERTKTQPFPIEPPKHTSRSTDTQASSATSAAVIDSDYIEQRILIRTAAGEDFVLDEIVDSMKDSNGNYWCLARWKGYGGERTFEHPEDVEFTTAFAEFVDRHPSAQLPDRLRSAK
ncbi:hypothetical protein JCM24511_07890 [Saitozyma sp. JCM 24511]|nr:hypothetical protein JCM24511_07890 [Saitozyma sp. JCM 24511]